MENEKTQIDKINESFINNILLNINENFDIKLYDPDNNEPIYVFNIKEQIFNQKYISNNDKS